MKYKFSDRIAMTSPPTVLQVEGMTGALRNSLWNYLLKTIFDGDSKYYISRVRLICERFFKSPMDSLPYLGYEHKSWLRELFFHNDFKWYQVYNLIEFIAEHCHDMLYTLKPETFKSGINQILQEEMSGYTFIGGLLAPISSPEEIQSIATSIQAAKERHLFGTQHHLETAVTLLSKKPTPDYRNSIKESISALESIVKQITGEESSGLDKALARLDAKVNFHGAFKSGLLSLYGYTSNEDGIRHAILEEPHTGFDEAKFMLVSCSALINFMISKASKHGLL